MSDSYYLACSRCKDYVWVGQSQNSDPPFCFYSGEEKTMRKLKHFLWDHRGHPLIMEDSQDLVIQGVLEDNEDGSIKEQEENNER
jgi:hypothetical protein